MIEKTATVCKVTSWSHGQLSVAGWLGSAIFIESPVSDQKSLRRLQTSVPKNANLSSDIVLSFMFCRLYKANSWLSLEGIVHWLAKQLDGKEYINIWIIVSSIYIPKLKRKRLLSQAQ